MPEDRFPEPEPEDWEPPSLDGDYEGPPLDVKPFQPVLTPLDIPPYVKPPDHTSDVPHWVPGVGPPMDQLDELTVQQEIDLLNKNNIYLSMKQLNPADDSGFGAMSAYVARDGGLVPARGFTPAVRFTKVRLRTPQQGMQQNTTYSYNEFESHLQRQFVTENKVEFGIPKVFKVNTEFGYASSTATHGRQVTVHFAANKWLAAAVVVFDETDITLESSFVERVRNIVRSKEPIEVRTNRLLEHLEEFGQFVPLTRVLGGRMSLRETTTLTDWTTFETTKANFGVAADARFKINNVPGQAGGGDGTGYWAIKDEARIAQAKSLKMECVGGNEKLADSNPIRLGGEWIDSVSPHRLWRTYGFEEQSLVPIINFLPDDELRKKTYLLLSNYFHSCLHYQDTGYSGHESRVDQSFEEKKLRWPNVPAYRGKAFDGDLKKVSRGLSQIVVNSEGNVDALKLSYRVYDRPFSGIDQYSTEVVTGPYYGNDRGKSHERTIDFSPGEEIRALEVWVDPDLDGGVLRSLAIKTNKGRRLPNATGFYGANPKPGQLKPKPGYLFEVIEVPRVRAVRGYSGAFVHSIALGYLDLDANAKSRPFLLAMEPFLYPTGDFGPLG